jgi:hypothetical protein
LRYRRQRTGRRDNADAVEIMPRRHDPASVSAKNTEFWSIQVTVWIKSKSVVASVRAGERFAPITCLKCQ